MKKQYLLFAAVLIFLAAGVKAQGRGGQGAQSTKPYSVVIKGGHVIDPRNNINELMDVAVTRGIQAQAAVEALPAREARPAQGGQPAVTARPAIPARAAVAAVEGKIALLAKNIDANLADRVVDAKGLYVTPGLIDMHTHLFWGHAGQQYKNGPSSIPPDGFTFRTGVTTVVDAGSPGWRDFETYISQTINRSATRVLVFLNIVGTGMGGNESNIAEMDAQKAAEMARKYPQHIVGIKTAHYSGPRGWTQIDRSIEAGRLANNIPIMVDFGSATPFLPLDSLFNVKFRPGDIYTHAFGGNGSSSPNGRESIVDMNGQIKPYVHRARQRGIIFDIGFGGSSFLYNQGVPAIKAGFYPNSISTDLHIGSMNSHMKTMENIMSLFVAIGMPLNEVIKASTWNPAQQVKRLDLGNLSVGSGADIAVFKLHDGQFGWPVRGGKVSGTKRLQTELTVRNGNVVYDLNGLGLTDGPTPAAPVAQQGGRGGNQPAAPR